MLSEQGTKICAICPHANECGKTGCLDDVNARYLASRPNQFPRLMTPIQAARCTALLREGWSLRRLYSGGGQGKPIVTPGKLQNHCTDYPEWGAEALQLAKGNAKAADSLKGSTKRARTHCGRGHEFAVHGLAYKNHVNGRRYRYCKACNTINGRQGSKLPTEIVEKVKALVRAGAPLNSFTGGGKPGYLCRFASVKLLRDQDPEFNNLVRLGVERRKLMGMQVNLTISKPHIIKPTNLRAPTLGGSVAGRADVVFSAVSQAVSSRLPRHIRDDVMGQLFLDVEEGRVALADIGQFARKYTNDIYQEEKRQISLDAPAFRDGTGGSRLDRISEADGMWAA
jgi:hypothetical protein